MDMNWHRAMAATVAMALPMTACGTRDRPSADPRGGVAATTSSSSIDLEGCIQLGVSTCAVTDYPDRPFEIHVPSSYDGSPIPLVVNFHGGGGSIESSRKSSCPEGDATSDRCLQAIGMQEGFVTVLPSGSPGPVLKEIRTWNAGGGGSEWNCASGRACQNGVDDIAYITQLLDAIEAQINVDTSRVFATGLSNGAAMAHRVACEMSERFTAIASVGGANQYSTTEDCTPTSVVSILHIHGTSDPCWTYETSATAFADRDGRLKLGAVDSTEGWAERNGCHPTSREEPMPDNAVDGMTTLRITWDGCDDGASVEHLRIEGGGHIWPNGHSFTRRAGVSTQDFGAEVVWEFFERVSA